MPVNLLRARRACDCSEMFCLLDRCRPRVATCGSHSMSPSPAKSARTRRPSYGGCLAGTQNGSGSSVTSSNTPSHFIHPCQRLLFKCNSLLEKEERVAG